MEDRTFSTNNHPTDGISDTFRQFIELLVEEVIINGESFEAQKKWLRKHSEAEGLNYETIESNLNDFFEAIKELEEHESKFVERSVRALAKEYYFSEALVNQLLDHAAAVRTQKEFDRKAQEEQEAEKNVLDVDKEGKVFCIDKSFQGKLSIPSTLKGTKVREIKNWAFDNCKALKSIVIPNSVTKLGLSAFGGCTGLTSIVIPNSVKEIDGWAFEGCSGLTSIVVSEGNMVYDSRGNCNAIIEKASNKLVSGCMNTVIPESVIEIGDYAFEDCSGLTGIVIPNSVTTIGRNAFHGCTGLTSIVIPKSVKEIDGWAFGGCTGLTSIVIPNSVKEIDGLAFEGCTGLTSIVVSGGNTVFDSRVNCNAIIETATNELIAGCKNTKVPDSVTEIGEWAFYGCTGLTSIVIPKSVTEIGSHAFHGCTGLTSIVIPESVTRIGWYAFEDCTGLTNIVIPNSVERIQPHTFEGCTGLTSIVIPNSVTEIENEVFKGCTGLTNIVIPDSVIRIGENAFQGCKSLTSIVIPNSVKEIHKTCFKSCNSLKSAKLPRRFDGCVGFSKRTKVEYY